MNKCLYNIFDNMQDKIPGQAKADKKISNEVSKEIATYEKQFPEYDWKALRDLCFSVAYAAKKEWFAVGFYYAIEDSWTIITIPVGFYRDNLFGA